MNLIWASVCLSQSEAQMPDDMSKVEAWYDQITHSPDSILGLVDSVLTNNTGTLDPTLLTYLYHIKSDCYYYLDDLRKSDEAIILALQSAPQDFMPGKLIEMHNSHGQNLDFLGKLDASLEAYKEGLKIAKRIKDSISLIDIYYNIGLVQYSSSQAEEALHYMDSCQQVSISIGDSSGISGVLRVRSSIYKQSGDFERSIRTSREGIKYVTATDPSLRCFHLLDIANTYYANNQIDSLFKYATLGKICSDSLNYGFSNIEVFKAFSHYYKEIGDTTNAIQNLDSIIAVAEKTGNMHEYYYGLISKYTYVIEDNQISEAIQATEKATELGLDRLVMLAYEKIAILLSEMERYEEAYDYLQKASNLKERFNREESIKQAEVQATKFNLYQKEAEARMAAEKLKSKQALYLMYGLLGISIFGLILGWNWYRNKKSKLILQQEKLAQETKLLQEIAEVESEAFRAQMNPHFIFNALNSIKGLIVNNQNKEAALYISKFSKLVRNVLDNSRSKSISLGEELKTLEMYIQLEQMRFRDGFDYEMTLSPGLEKESIQIPPVTIQPFVENSIWHGFKNNVRENKLWIKVEEIDAELHLIIEDNGVGRKIESQPNNRISHGIEITKQRIANFSNDYSVNRLIFEDLKSKDGDSLGTRVRIVLPIKMYSNE